MSGPGVDAYLAVVAARLDGPRRARAQVIDELHDGLLTATEGHRRRGLPGPEAEQTAVREFGPPEALAKLFAEELACLRARGIGRAYLLTGPLVGSGWLTLLAPPDWWRLGPQALWTSLPALPLVVAAVLVGLGLLRGARGDGPALMTAPDGLLDLAVLLAALCFIADLVTIAALSGAPPGSGSGLLVTAMLASAGRMACSCLAVRRCLRGRRALHA